MVSFRRSIFLLMFIFFLLISCNCNKTKQPEEIKLLILDNGLSISPIYAGFYQDFFQEEGLKLTLIKNTDNKNPLDLLTGGICDVLIIGNESPLSTIDNPQKEKLIFFAGFGKKDFSFLVTREKADVFQWQDLKGKVIISGESEHFSNNFMEFILKNNQLKPHKHVDIIQNLPYSLAIGAFKGGLGNYIILYEPEISELESKDLGYPAIFLGDIETTPFPLAVTTEAYLQSHPDTIQKLTNAFYKGQIWLNNNIPEKILPAIMAYFPQNESQTILKALYRGKKLDIWADNPLINKESINNLEKILNDSRLRKYEIILRNRIDNSFAEKAVANIELPTKDK